MALSFCHSILLLAAMASVFAVTDAYLSAGLQQMLGNDTDLTSNADELITEATSAIQVANNIRDAAMRVRNLARDAKSDNVEVGVSDVQGVVSELNSVDSNVHALGIKMKRKLGKVMKMMQNPIAAATADWLGKIILMARQTLQGLLN